MNILKEQIIPIFLTFITFLFITLGLILYAHVLNLFPISEKIAFHINLTDIAVGLAIYLKTAIDFALFIGNLIRSNPGWKKRIAIEIGTSFGNAIGTIIILTIWFFFKDIKILLALMIAIASLVLLRMAEEGIRDFIELNEGGKMIRPLKRAAYFLSLVNKIFSPIIGRFLPKGKLLGGRALTFPKLLLFSFTVPFILGLDDFAGYIPLFSIVNVISFSIGVFLGHLILCAALFINPRKTVSLIETPIIIIFGSTAFLFIALYGFYEVIKILILH